MMMMKQATTKDKVDSRIECDNDGNQPRVLALNRTYRLSDSVWCRSVVSDSNPGSCFGCREYVPPSICTVMPFFRNEKRLCNFTTGWF